MYLTCPSCDRLQGKSIHRQHAVHHLAAQVVCVQIVARRAQREEDGQEMVFGRVGAGARSPPKNSARLCVMLPDPTTSTPWLRRLRSAAPSAYTSAGPAPTGKATCTTGTSACSKPSTSCASAGEPEAGYCSWYSAGGKPPKSCHVAGCGPVMTWAERAIQCGDMMTTPRRPGYCALRFSPHCVSAGPVVPASIANSGAPRDTNKAGTTAGAVRGAWAKAVMAIPSVNAMNVGLIAPGTKPCWPDRLFYR